MQDLLDTLRALRRPPLLIRAARIGLDDYRREIHLRRHMHDGTLPFSAEALIRLIRAEAILEQDRRIHAMGYSPMQHVNILIAVMGEARLLCPTPTLVEA